MYAASRSGIRLATSSPGRPSIRIGCSRRGGEPDRLGACHRRLRAGARRASAGSASTTEYGRALAAGNRRRQREPSSSRHSRAAIAPPAIDLARLLTRAPASAADGTRALSLLERAWNQGASMAAFELGSLYERGVSGVSADPAQAWSWYRRGADSWPQPHALARYGQSELEAAQTARGALERRRHRLEAFKFYASAAEQAQREGWPDEAWRNWRLHRASLARLLAPEEACRTWRAPTRPPSGLLERPRTRERQEGDQLLLLFLGQIHLESLIVEIHELVQVGGGAVVEIRRAGRESPQDRALTAVEVAAQPGDERLARIARVERFDLPGIEGIRAAADQIDRKVGHGELASPAAMFGSGSTLGSTECEVPISSGSGNE